MTDLQFLSGRSSLTAYAAQQGGQNPLCQLFPLARNLTARHPRRTQVQMPALSMAGDKARTRPLSASAPVQPQPDAQVWRSTNFSAHLAAVAHHCLGVSAGSRASPAVGFCQGQPGSKPANACWAGRCPQSWAGSLLSGVGAAEQRRTCGGKGLHSLGPGEPGTLIQFYHFY